MLGKKGRKKVKGCRKRQTKGSNNKIERVLFKSFTETTQKSSQGSQEENHLEQRRAMTAQSIQSKHTIVGKSKKEQIIKTKLKNPHLSLKEIARIIPCSYSHARAVWAEYQRGIIQKRGSPSSPFSVQGSWKETIVPAGWLKDCPLNLSKNRNGQRVWKGSKTTMVFHKNGKIMLYAYYDGWEQEVREFLCSFWNNDQIDLFILNLQDRGKRAVAFNTPKVPRNFKVKVRGIGTLLTDTTPYPDGTTEFQLDPEILKQMDAITKCLKNLTTYFVKLQQQNIKALETNAHIIKQNTEALQQFTEFMKGLSQPRKTLPDKKVGVV